MGTAPAPTGEDVLQFHMVQLSSNIVHKAGFPSCIYGFTKPSACSQHKYLCLGM